MLVIGITGPSGAGKGVVSGYLAEKGIPVIDADAVYHIVITPPSPCLDELVLHFGSEVLTASGELDRKALAGIVFDSENGDRLKLLNSITHKYVVARIRDLVKKYKTSSVAACVIDAPLLIEAGLVADCDVTVAVLADREKRAKRICARDGISLEAAYMRIDSQKPDSYYAEHSDLTIRNDGSMSVLREAMDKLLSERGALR